MKRYILILCLVCVGASQLRSQNPNAAKFPAAVVTDADIGVAKNRARALLTGDIDNATLTVNVDNGAAFAYPSWGSIGQEFIKICSIAGNVITLCADGRGAFGSTAAAHSTGDTITGPLLDQHVNQLAAEVKAIETALGINFNGSNAVQGRANLTGGSRIVLTGATGSVTQSAATLNTAGSMSIPYGQTLAFYGTNNHVFTRLFWNSFWIYGGYNGTTQMAIGEAATNDDVVHIGYTRGTIGAGAGLLKIGQVAKVNANWTHGVTSFLTLGVERARINGDGNFLVGTDTDDASGAKIQVNGTVKATGFTGPLTGDVAGNVSGNAGSVTDGVYTSGSYADPAWITSLAKSKVGLGSVEDTALSTWTGTTNITTIGALGTYVKAPKQINLTLFDPNVALPATTIPGVWRAEYGGITATSVSCSADTADAVIQLTAVVLTSNLTCSNAGWATTTSFSTATLAQGSSIGLQVVSGTAKRINVSIQYTQQ